MFLNLVSRIFTLFGIRDFYTVFGKINRFLNQQEPTLTLRSVNHYHVDRQRLRWYIKFGFMTTGSIGTLRAGCLTEWVKQFRLGITIYRCYMCSEDHAGKLIPPESLYETSEEWIRFYFFRQDLQD